MSANKINQKEYLKKYLSGDKEKRKKKDKHKKSVRVKIIDDDYNHLDIGVNIDEELLLTGEDAPQIVCEYIEENPAERIAPKWKSIVVKHDPEDIVAESLNLRDSKITNRNIYEYSPTRHKATLRNNKHEVSPRCAINVKAKPQSPVHQKAYRGGDLSETSPAPKMRQSDSSYRSRHKILPKDHHCQSPNRRRNGNHSPPEKTKSPMRSDRKQSPIYRRRNSDQSPSRRCRIEDRSPPRRKNVHQLPSDKNKSPMNDRTNSPINRRRNSDQSPPRRGKNQDQSPPRRKNVYPFPLENPRSLIGSDRKNGSIRRRRNSSQTPPRIPRRHSKSPQRHRKDSDHSPSNKKNIRDCTMISHKKIKTSRTSPYKQKRHTPDYSPRRKAKTRPSQSPPRRTNSFNNSSPISMKREKATPELSPQTRYSRWEKQETERSDSPPPTHKPKQSKTLEGKKAGLQDSKALHKESMDRRKQEDVLFKKMSTHVSGRNAEVQVRSTGRKGRRAREKDEENPEERQRKKAHEEQKKLLYDRWGKGLKQLEDHKSRMLEQEYESSKPLARYSNDEDLDRLLKEKERAEDPMLEYMRQKRKEQEKRSGKPEMPRYEGPYPDNRFGIRPGYRWDGVDRSNGYEKKYFAVQNERKALQDESYKYSVEDM